MILQHLLLLSVFLAIPVSTLGTKPGQIKNLVTFGDSYTDVVRDFLCRLCSPYTIMGVDRTR